MGSEKNECPVCQRVLELVVSGGNYRRRLCTVCIDRRRNNRVGAEPTNTIPGSIERVDVYASRVEHGMPVFWPGDKVDLDGSTGHRSVYKPNRGGQRGARK